VVVPLCIEAVTEPIVSYLSRDICCQLCLVVSGVVVAVVQAGDGVMMRLSQCLLRRRLLHQKLL
jgi:hypothetical protein